MTCYSTVCQRLLFLRSNCCALASALSHAALTYESCLQLHKNPASLEGPAGLHNEESTLADYIEDDSAVDPDEAAVHKMLTKDMNQLLYTLSERESEVLRLRYGLEDGMERTLEEVGRVMMVSIPRFVQ